MKPTGMVRYVVAAAMAVAMLLAIGCGPPRRRAAAPDVPPRIRVQGARIMEADPQLQAAPPAAPAAEMPEPVDVGPPANPGPPDDVAVDVKVSLDSVDARVTEVLRGLALQGGVDLVLGSVADRRITLRLQETPWVEAFNAVLSGANLVAEWEGRRVRVLTTDQLRTEREATEKLDRQRPRTAVIPLQNLMADDAAKALASVLSEGGRIGIDEERNALIVTDTPLRVEAVSNAVSTLDHAPPQVMIEAIIVDITLTDDLHYGFDWTATRIGGDQATLRQALRVGAGVNAATSPGGSLTFTVLGNPWTITGVYDMLQSMDNVKILANPRVLAVNNRKAQIEIIDEIPYQVLTQTSAGGQIGTTSFKEVGVKLEVKPRIAADGGVHLEVTAEQSAPTGASVNQIPVIQTRRSTTVMSVTDGQVVALGGLRRHRAVTNEDKIPLLGDIPGIGMLFRRIETVDVDTELVVFIRPKIVPKGQGLTARERTMAEAINNPDRRPQIIKSDPLRLHVKDEDDRARRVP